jgi:hypothetical protein
MKYRKTFREALNDVAKKDKPEAKPEVKPEAPAEQENDPQEEIKSLKDKIAKLEMDLKIANDATLRAEPNPDTGEIPLRTGVAAALLDKNGPSPKIQKNNKEKVKLSSGKSKIAIDPDVPIGIISGGIDVGSGNQN